jgi:hypothetical protein
MECNMPLKKRTTRSSRRIIRPPVVPPSDESPWCDESSDCDPSYVPETLDDDSVTTTVTDSEYSEAVESDSDSSS